MAIENRNEIALIVIYNHQYNKNIDVVEAIYKNRFTHIFHLVPFYTGNKSNVIPVYENSFYFEGYVAQGFHRFFHERFRHYFFIGDDLILNPIIDENNYAEIFKLKKDTCFIPDIVLLHKEKGFWHRQIDAFRYWIHVKGVEAEAIVPSFIEALEIFRKQGLEIQPLSFDQVNEKQVFPEKLEIRKLYQYFFYKLSRLKNHKRPYLLAYPLVGSYSDIFVVSAAVLPRFCHYCGVFAATNLHAELAIPTAMVLTAEDIKLEKDLELAGNALWTEEDFEILKPFGSNLDLLLEKFPAKHLYLHPVKLSKWKFQQQAAL
jgi:hypothetical protein